MNWIQNLARPKIKALFTKRDTPDNLWYKCPHCAEMVFHRDIKAAHNVCPKCSHHGRLSAADRLSLLFGDQTPETIAIPDTPQDPLKFRDTKRYTDRLKEARTKSGRNDAFIVAVGKLEDQPVVVALQDFAFMGGSLGTAAGEAIVTAANTAVERKAPLIMFSASGGARMQEGILSLMQMPRSTVAVQRLRAAGLPYIVVLTDPTSGGVTASYAMLGDIQIAEPGAMIAFSGPRVIEQTIREKLPDGFQRAEYLLEHGMIDMVVSRGEMIATLARLVRLLMANTSPTSTQTNEPGETDSAALPAPTTEPPATDEAPQ